jgi:cytoskeletal protein RodZ
MDGSEFRSRDEAEQPTEQPVEQPVLVEPEQKPIEPANASLETAAYEPLPQLDTTGNEKTEPKKKKHVLFITIVAVLVVLGVVFFLWKDQILGVFIHQPVASKTDDSSTTSTQDETKITDPALLKFITPTTGEAWYKTPKEMESQGWLKNDYRNTFVSQYMTKEQVDEEYARMKPTYYEVGTHGDKTIIMARQPAEMGSEYAVFFEKTTSDVITVIARPSSTATYDQYYLPSLKDSLAGKATIDETTHYDSLSIPDAIALKDGDAVQSLKSPSFLFGSKADGTTETVVMNLGASTLYRIEKSYADTKLTNIGYAVRTNFGTEMQVDYVPNTRSLEKYVFDNGKVATYKDYQGAMVYDEINAIARGCGGTSAAVTRADSLQDGDLVAVGKTDTGRVVYGLKDTTSALMTKAYGEYKQAYPDNPASLTDYIANHGLVIIKNAAGERLVYVRGQYAMNGGCAKPVVYLYPTATTNVSVQVGANVTVSEPQYTKAGWQNVTAQPNGKLTYNGAVYDSLFWEGTGYGEYPGISAGTVVARADVVPTMKRQLVEQGLNAKEAADFITFWQDKIPSSPYVRLTWLNTAQMDTLAPLYVSPKPDTVIRVFLDMEGFDTKLSLPAQKLSSTFRHGFTVVEWGGLTSLMK